MLSHYLEIINILQLPTLYFTEKFKISILRP